MNTPALDLVTVKEAAAMLRVHPSTIRRWIDAGEIKAYRVGKKRLCLRRGDVEATARIEMKGHGGAATRRPHPPHWKRPDYVDAATLLNDARIARTYQLERERFLKLLDVKPLTEEESAHARSALKTARAALAEQLAERGGVPYPDSAEDLFEIREQRSRELT